MVIVLITSVSTILVYVVYRLRMHVQMIEIDWMDRLLIKC